MEPTAHIRFGPFRLDPRQRRLWRGKRKLELQPRPLAVLQYLVEHAGQVVTKEALLHQLWAGTVVTQAVLKVSVRAIREALGEDAATPRYIETVGREGYRFIAPLSSPQPVQRSTVKVQRSETRNLPSLAPNRGPWAADFPTPSPQPAAPLVVGRETELAQLRAWLVKALEGQRQVVFVAGEPGIGKTTVVDRFLAEVRTQPSVWIGRGQCVEHYGEGEAYLPILEALGQVCRGSDGQPLQEALSRSAPTWLAQLPGLLETAELETVQRRAAGASRERMLRELAEAVETLTSTGAGTAPPLLVLVCEDLHVSDHSTVEWLAYLARRRGEARLLVIGTYRPAELVVRQHPLRNVVQELKAHNQCQQLLLDLLTEAHVTTYLAQRLQTEEALQVLAQQLHQRTGGNPLFMVNITDYLIHQGVLREEAGGRWRLHGDLTAVETPENLRQMIGTQLDGVSEAERRVLETASVAGNEFTVASVAAALQEELNLVEEICEDLVWKGRFLQERGLAEWPDGTLSGHYEFRHVLYQNVLYRRIGEARRVRLHRLIGERAEAGYGERAREIAAELAVHFEQGREVPRALRYLQRSAENALRRNAYPEAIRALTRGLTLLGTLPEAPERDQQELALQLALGGALVGGENHGALGVDQAYARARILCQRMGETPQLFLALSGMAGFYYSRGNMETGYELAQQCLQVAQRLQHPAFLTSAHATLGLMSVGLGTFADAREHFAQATAFYDARPRRSRSLLPTTDQEVLARSYLAVALWMLGYPDQGLYSAQHALALAEQIEHPPSLGFALTFVGMVQGYRREEQAAQATADRMMAMAQEQALPAWQPHGTYARGEALVLQGQYAQGIEYIRRAIAYCTSMGIESGQTWRAARLAEAYGKAGDVAMGLQTVDEGFALVRKNGDPFYDAELWRTKGELLLNAERRRMKDEG